MKDYIEATKKDRDVEKWERKEIQNFIDTPAVNAVFDKYQRQLLHMFKFYAAQDPNKDKLSYNSDYLVNTLSYKEFVRWGYQ